jgi:hypothetical protein
MEKILGVLRDPFVQNIAARPRRLIKMSSENGWGGSALLWVLLPRTKHL